MKQKLTAAAFGSQSCSFFSAFPKTKHKRIEIYNLDKQVDVTNVPKDLRHLVLTSKTVDFT